MTHYSDEAVEAFTKVIKFIDEQLQLLCNNEAIASKAGYHEVVYDFYRDISFYDGDFADHLIKAVNEYRNGKMETVVNQLLAAKKLLESEIAANTVKE